jgi:hypothetical protein
MQATTIGTGPFYPKIVFGDVYYAHLQAFISEDDAQAMAQSLVNDIERMVNWILLGAGYIRDE